MVQDITNDTLLKIHFQKLIELSRELHKTLDVVKELLNNVESDDYMLKDSLGKLTTFGKHKLTIMLADGKSNTEIAEYFGIANSAVSYHRSRCKNKS